MEIKNFDLIKKIQFSMDKFSKGQKLIANYIVNHYDKAVTSIEEKGSKV